MLLRTLMLVELGDFGTAIVLTARSTARQRSHSRTSSAMGVARRNDVGAKARSTTALTLLQREPSQLAEQRPNDEQ
jgi:hypothetical protein